MPKTLLAVDDSATMRKVLEITFSGEDFRVVTADGAQNALSRLGDDPGVVIIDTVLGGDDGYALCKEVRKRAPGAALLLLASRHNPYDQAKGREAGADDFMDKPFDTQQMLDKVRKVILARESGGAQPQAASPAAAPPPQAAPQPRPATAAQPAFTPQPASAASKPARGHTLMFGDQGAPQAAAPPDRRAEPAPQERRPEPAPAEKRPEAAKTAPDRAEPRHQAPAATSPTPANAMRPVAPAHVAPPQHPVSHATASVNGQLAGKLGELGLSQQQLDAVLALSREVVERVVWEVVPQLAETLIKEEIARLTKEG